MLVALDGIMSAHTGLVTVATTNDPSGLDVALCGARFDRDLAHYLAGLDEATAEIDADKLPSATEMPAAPTRTARSWMSSTCSGRS